MLEYSSRSIEMQFSIWYFYISQIIIKFYFEYSKSVSKCMFLHYNRVYCSFFYIQNTIFFSYRCTHTFPLPLSTELQKNNMKTILPLDLFPLRSVYNGWDLKYNVHHKLKVSTLRTAQQFWFSDNLLTQHSSFLSPSQIVNYNAPKGKKWPWKRI